MRRTLFSAALAVAAALLTVGMAVSAQEADGKTDWREDYAYTLGVQAYIFGFPYVYLPSLRWDWVTQSHSSRSRHISLFRMLFSKFAHES